MRFDQRVYNIRDHINMYFEKNVEIVRVVIAIENRRTHNFFSCQVRKGNNREGHFGSDTVDI